MLAPQVLTSNHHYNKLCHPYTPSLPELCPHLQNPFFFLVPNRYKRECVNLTKKIGGFSVANKGQNQFYQSFTSLWLMVKTGSLIFEHCQLSVYIHIPYPYPAIPGSNKWEPPNSGYDSDQGWAGI
jgi:hypothetical protein